MTEKETGVTIINGVEISGDEKTQLLALVENTEWQNCWDDGIYEDAVLQLLNGKSIANTVDFLNDVLANFTLSTNVVNLATANIERYRK